MRKDDGFTATGKFYSFRPGYPPDAIRWVVERLGLDGSGRMLDVGCGTGHACFCFAGQFAQIIGIDPSAPMLDEAKAIALKRGASGFEFRQMKAEDLPADLGAFRLICFGASFHRVDRERVLDICHGMLEPGGGLALLFPSVPWRGDALWKEAIRHAIKDWTGKTIGGPFELSQNFITRSQFGVYQESNFAEMHTWSAEEVIGYLKSTSVCSPAALGERTDAFGRDLTSRLLKLQPDGRFRGVLETTVVLAVRR